MPVSDAEVNDLMRTLERVEEKMERLRGERQKLLEANRQLVHLVETVESIFEKIDEETKEAAEDSFRMEDHEYSFDEGWRPKTVVHEQDLDLDLDAGVDVDEIDRQIREVRSMLDTIRSYKNEQAGGDNHG